MANINIKSKVKNDIINEVDSNKTRIRIKEVEIK